MTPNSFAIILRKNDTNMHVTVWHRRIETVASEIEESVIKAAMALAHRATQEIIAAQLSKVFKKKLIPSVTGGTATTSPSSSSSSSPPTPTPTPTPMVAPEVSASVIIAAAEKEVVAEVVKEEEPKIKSKAKPRAKAAAKESTAVTSADKDTGPIERAGEPEVRKSRGKRVKKNSDVTVVVAKQAAQRKPKKSPKSLTAEAELTGNGGESGEVVSKSINAATSTSTDR